MINLLPPKGHTALKHEYILRVASMYGFILAGVFIAGTILMVPTYVLVSSQLNTVRPEDAQIDETKKIYDEALSHVQSANTTMAQLRSSVPNADISALITEIIRVAPPGITFHTFQVLREEALVKSVEVQGEATTRNALAALKNTLEASTLFETARIPISDLARENELPFVVTVTLSDMPKAE